MPNGNNVPVWEQTQEGDEGLQLDWIIDTDLDTILEEFVSNKGLTYGTEGSGDWRDAYYSYFLPYDSTMEDMAGLAYELESDMYLENVLSEMDQFEQAVGGGKFVTSADLIDSHERVERMTTLEGKNRLLEFERDVYKEQGNWLDNLYSQIIRMAEAEIFINEDYE